MQNHEYDNDLSYKIIKSLEKRIKELEEFIKKVQFPHNEYGEDECIGCHGWQGVCTDDCEFKKILKGETK